MRRESTEWSVFFSLFGERGKLGVEGLSMRVKLGENRLHSGIYLVTLALREGRESVWFLAVSQWKGSWFGMYLSISRKSHLCAVKTPRKCGEH